MAEATQAEPRPASGTYQERKVAIRQTAQLDYGPPRHSSIILYPLEDWVLRVFAVVGDCPVRLVESLARQQPG